MCGGGGEKIAPKGLICGERRLVVGMDLYLVSYESVAAKRDFTIDMCIVADFDLAAKRCIAENLGFSCNPGLVADLRPVEDSSVVDDYRASGYQGVARNYGFMHDYCVISDPSVVVVG